MKFLAFSVIIYSLNLCSIIKYKSLDVFVSGNHYKKELSNQFIATLDLYISFGYIHSSKSVGLNEYFNVVNTKFNLHLNSKSEYSICSIATFEGDEKPERSIVLEIKNITLKEKNRIVKKIEEYYKHDWFDIFTPSYRITWSNNTLMLLFVDIGAPDELYNILQLKN
jgi:hypothetical protein